MVKYHKIIINGKMTLSDKNWLLIGILNGSKKKFAKQGTKLT